MGKQLIFVAVVCLACMACKKDYPIGPQPTTSIPTDTTNSEQQPAWVICEGTYTWSNASITLIDQDLPTLSNYAFQAANNRTLGDVAQSVAFHQNRAYIVVNNSGKIEVVEQQSLESIATLDDFESPRYLLPYRSDKALVTDLYSNSISVLNLNSLEVEDRLPVGGWTEQMVQTDDYVFIAGTGTDRVYVFNKSLETLVDSIPVGVEPNSLVLDKNAAVWVLCSGGFQEDLPKLLRIDISSFSVVQSLDFPDLSESPDRLIISTDGSKLYYLNQGLYRMEIEAGALPTTPLLSEDEYSYYAVGVSPATDHIFLSCPGDFVSAGQVLLFDAQLTPLDTFLSGIGPGNIYFP